MKTRQLPDAITLYIETRYKTKGCSNSATNVYFLFSLQGPFHQKMNFALFPQSAPVQNAYYTRDGGLDRDAAWRLVQALATSNLPPGSSARTDLWQLPARLWIILTALGKADASTPINLSN